MANEKIKNNYRDIADAIRAKTGENGKMTAEEMPAKIEAIPTGITPTGTIDITINGDHDVAEYGTAHVAVPNPSTGTKYINSNGKHDVINYAYASVNVPLPTIINFSNYPYPIEQEGISKNVHVNVDNTNLNIIIYIEFSVNLSDLSEDCSNLSYLVDEEVLAYNETCEAPILLLQELPGTTVVYASIELMGDTWPYFDSRRAELETAASQLNSYLVYDITGTLLADVNIIIGGDS